MSRWAVPYAQALARGERVSFRPKGRSMEPLVRSGQLVTVEPATVAQVDVDDIVLCYVAGNDYLHLVKAKQGNRVLIGNNRGGTNGWTSEVYGRLVLTA